jgi:biotin synthase
MEVQKVLEEAARAGHRLDPLLHGRGLEAPVGQRHALRVEMVKGVKAMGLETCMTLGRSTRTRPKPGPGGLDYYNHNLDTSPEFYGSSSPPAPTPSACKPWPTCAMRG